MEWFPTRPNDQVYGYTLGQLEDALPGPFGSWWSWGDHVFVKCTVTLLRGMN